MALHQMLKPYGDWQTYNHADLQFSGLFIGGEGGVFYYDVEDKTVHLAHFKDENIRLCCATNYGKIYFIFLSHIWMT